MQTLNSLQGVVTWLRSHVTGVLRVDSRQVQPGDGFIAWPGAATDGRAFVPQALASGATASLIERNGSDTFKLDSTPGVASFEDLKANTGPIAAAYYNAPSETLAVLAVTGTNGKTSTSWWLAQMLSKVTLPRSWPCAVMGTLGSGVPPEVEATGLTTPNPVQIQEQFRCFADAGLAACAIEASSIGIAERRLDGTRIRIAIFTNFTQDHLDYHGSMDAYWRAKEELFARPGLETAVLNVDDPKGELLAQKLAGGVLDVWTVSCERDARLRATDIGYTEKGLVFTVIEGAERQRVETPLIGLYNVHNMLGVMGAMRALGVPLHEVVRVCAFATPVPGRMDCLSEPGQPLVAIDYAHTPDALDKALQALHPMAKARGGKLWCVFGCGGDRDTAKRPLMAAVAEKRADVLVVTSDNPRSERPEAIISQILLGASNRAGAHVQADRALAIAETLAQADARDVVLLAGKGHEATQEIAGVKHAFSDKTHAQAALTRRAHLQQSSHGMHADSTEVMMTLGQALALMPGGRLFGAADTPILRVHTDTRTLQPGDLFVALRGERFDANTMLAQAKASGAVAALCHPGAGGGFAQTGLPCIEVNDTLAALGTLASGWRAQFTLPLIAVTGSNGKTTVTQMLASVLRAEVNNVSNASLATQGNYNNDIGVPLTLLRLRAHHRLAVVELGMNHPGEIAKLAAMARPTVALVNNAQREHMEFMATVEAVAQENGQVFRALSADGVAVFPADEPYAGLWRQLADGRRCSTFAWEAGADVFSATEPQWLHNAWQAAAQTHQGVLPLALHIAGRHNVKNALAVIACALAAGVSPEAVTQGLAAFQPVKGRSRALPVFWQGRAITLVDDSYNANPDSVLAAIDVLAALPGPRLLVLGDMGEVGDQGPQFHTEMGARARQVGIEHVFTLGTLAAHVSRSFGAGRHFENIDALNTAVRTMLPEVASILVKGSRFMQMPRVVEFVQTQTAPASVTTTKNEGAAPC